MDAPSIAAEPPAASDEPMPAPPGADASEGESEGEVDRVVLGVAGLIADALGLDALWVRLAFVVAALTGGIGVVLYLAFWVVFFGPGVTGFPWVRYLGGAAVVIGMPLLIVNNDIEFVDGPVAVIALLVGLALAMWQPRAEPVGGAALARPATPRAFGRRPTVQHEPDPADPPEPSAPPLVVGVAAGGSLEAPTARFATRSERRRRRWTRPPRPKREPSMLGRSTFGLAVIVAAIGALIDHFNGGRLHPEQWLGIAAVVCGLGLLAGAVRGRARWLIVPALLFAGVGYIAGLGARLGIDVADAFGEHSMNVSGATPGGTRSLRTLVGDQWISIESAPTAPLTIDARSAIGRIDVSVTDDVAIEVTSQTERGDLRVNGIVVPGRTARLGPDRSPDVIVETRQGLGDVRVMSYDAAEMVLEDVYDSLLGEGPYDPLVYAHADGVQVSDGVGVSNDDWIVLAYGEALLAPDGSIVVGDVISQGPGAAAVATSMGTYVIDGSVLQTPTGPAFEIFAIRPGAVTSPSAPSSSGTSPATVAPSTAPSTATVPPSTAPARTPSTTPATTPSTAGG